MTATLSAAASPAVIEHPLRNRNYRLWLAGATISLLGDQFYLVALPWLILMQTSSAVAMGTIMMVGAIPRAALMLVGGAVSDRISARKIMMTTALVRTALVAAIGALALRGTVEAWELYVLVFAFGVADAFAIPAAASYMPSLVKREQLVAASSIGRSASQLASVVGPIPAGFVIRTFGTASAFFADALSFLFIIAALWKLPDPNQAQPARPSVTRSILEGIKYVLNDVPLRSLMLLATIMNICMAGPVLVGLAFVSNNQFGSAAAYGSTISAVAAGGVLGALLAGVWKIRSRGPLILMASVVLGVCLASIALLGQFWSLACVLFAMGVTAGLVNVHINAWVMQRVEAAMRGRVASVLMLAAVGCTPISIALAGLLVEWNLKLMFLLSGGVMVVVAIGAAFQSAVREIQ